MATAEQYRSTSTHLFDQAMVELEEGDLIQASEKLWGSAAQALKCLAESRGWRHDSHAQFFNIMAALRDEAQGVELRRYFDAASQLHTNFYENWLDEVAIRERASDVRQFIEEIDLLRNRD